jgi:hypothetical protein
MVGIVVSRCQNAVMQWWFCLIHKVVEENVGCPNASRLGPYETRELAETAIERISKRQEDLDSEED